MSEQPEQTQEASQGGASDQTSVATNEPSTPVEQMATAATTDAGPTSEAAPETTASQQPSTDAASTTAQAGPPSVSGQTSASPEARSTATETASSHSGRTSSAKSKNETGGSPSTGGGGTSSARSSHKKKRMKLGELDLATAKIGFVGAGKMAESTINGLIHYAKIKPANIHVAAPSSKGLERFKALGCRVTKRNYDIFGRYDCDIIFLCFHGFVIKHCYKLGGARPHPLTTNYIPHQRHPIYILSLVSGVSLSQIKACLLNPESNSRYMLEIHRIMMNTAVGHGLGICAIDCEPDSKKLSSPIRQLLSSIAQLENVPASQMDAACAIGGSGLAFSYYFINALADGAFKMGLSRQQAIRFASKTASCAAQTMLESGKHPAELRDNVSSPSGAAIYGIHVLEKNDVASGVTAAVEAAHKRANDLATQDVQ